MAFIQNKYSEKFSFNFYVEMIAIESPTIHIENAGQSSFEIV